MCSQPKILCSQEMFLITVLSMKSSTCSIAMISALKSCLQSLPRWPNSLPVWDCLGWLPLPRSKAQGNWNAKSVGRKRVKYRWSAQQRTFYFVIIGFCISCTFNELLAESVAVKLCLQDQARHRNFCAVRICSNHHCDRNSQLTIISGCHC